MAGANALSPRADAGHASIRRALAEWRAGGAAAHRASERSHADPGVAATRRRRVADAGRAAGKRAAFRAGLGRAGPAAQPLGRDDRCERGATGVALPDLELIREIW